jgi:hypothetical protein
MWGATRPDPSPATASPSGLLTVKAVLAALLLLTLGAGVTAVASAPTVYPPAETYGQAGQRFEIEFVSPPESCWHPGLCGTEPIFGYRSRAGIVSTSLWTSGRGSAYENVTVSVFRNAATGNRAFSFLDATSQIPGTVARTWVEGYPAVRTIASCFEDADACSGEAGELDVLAGGTLYSVLLNGYSHSLVQHVLGSFRIVAGRATSNGQTN